MLPALLILDALVVLLLLFVVVRRTDSPGALPFLGLLGGVLLYNFGYGLELMTPPGVMSYFWNHFQYWGISTVPAFWLWMAIETPQQRKLRSYIKLGFLFLIPALTLTLNLTNDWHHWYYASLTFERVGDLTIAHIVRGPWYFVHIGFSLIVFAVALIVFAVRWPKLEHGYGHMALGMWLGVLFYLATVVIYQFGFVPDNLDLNPIGMTLSILTYYVVLWPARLFEMIPLSREMVFRVIPEPVLVTDKRGRLVDWNPAAVGLFPALTGARAGWELSRVVTERSWLETLRDGSFEQPIALAQGSLTPAYWSIAPTPVTDSNGRTQGRVFLFRNVTDLVAKNTLLERLDMTDPETGLFKEGPFRERAGAQLAHRSRRGEPVSLLLLEIPDAADRPQILSMAHLWSSQLGLHHLMARLGEALFGVLTPGLTPPRALSLAETLCSKARARGVRAVFGVSGITKVESAALDALWLRAEGALTKARGNPRTVGCLAPEDTSETVCLDEGDLP